MKTRLWKRSPLAAGLGAMVLLAAACVAQPKPGSATPAAAAKAGGGNRFKVRAESSPLYKLGPQQPGGPDLSLKQGTHLTVIKRSYGYSQVQLDGDGGSGIVGNEDLVPLTPQELAAEQAPTPNPNGGPAPIAGGPGAKNRRRAGSARLPGPAPLSLGDEPSLPGSEPAPARTGPTPSFRY